MAQHHDHLLARRRGEAALPRRQLLRRAGLHGAQGAGGVQREGAGRRFGVHPDRHHHRAQPRRLLPQQRHEVRGGDHRDQRRGTAELSRRSVRRVHHGRLRSRRDPLHLHRSGRPRGPARDHLQGAAGSGHPSRRRPVVRHRDLGVERHGHRRGEGGYLRQRRRDAVVLQGSRGAAPAGGRGQPGCGARPRGRLGLQHHQVGRQLRGDLRAQHRG